MINEKTETLKAEKDEKNKGMSEREQRVENKVKEKKLSKEDAEKEVAKETVKEKTGYSAESMAAIGRDVLYAKDGFEKPNAKQAAEGMNRIKGNAVEGMLEKMTDSKVAEDIVKAGLGAEHTSTGQSGLEQGARTVLEKSREFGEGSRMEGMLADAALGGMGISQEDAGNMTPDRLKEMINQYKNSEGKNRSENGKEEQTRSNVENQAEAPQKGQSMELLKKMADKLAAKR